MKVSRPIQDICNHCYVFAHRHKFFADHTMKQVGRYYDDDYDQQEEEAGDDLVLGDHNDQEVADKIATLTTSFNLSRPYCAIDKVAEQREQMMLDAAEHIKMVRAQCQLYQASSMDRKVGVFQ